MAPLWWHGDSTHEVDEAWVKAATALTIIDDPEALMAAHRQHFTALLSAYDLIQRHIKRVVPVIDIISLLPRSNMTSSRLPVVTPVNRSA